MSPKTTTSRSSGYEREMDDDGPPAVTLTGGRKIGIGSYEIRKIGRCYNHSELAKLDA